MSRINYRSGSGTLPRSWLRLRRRTTRWMITRSSSQTWRNLMLGLWGNYCLSQQIHSEVISLIKSFPFPLCINRVTHKRYDFRNDCTASTDALFLTFTGPCSCERAFFLNKQFIAPFTPIQPLDRTIPSSFSC